MRSPRSSAAQEAFVGLGCQHERVVAERVEDAAASEIVDVVLGEEIIDEGAIVEEVEVEFSAQTFPVAENNAMGVWHPQAEFC